MIGLVSSDGVIWAACVLYKNDLLSRYLYTIIRMTFILHFLTYYHKHQKNKALYAVQPSRMLADSVLLLLYCKIQCEIELPSLCNGLPTEQLVILSMVS